MDEAKRNKIFNVLICIISIVSAIIIGIVVYNDTYPKYFSQEEQEYYKEIALKAWNKGLNSIIKEIGNNNTLKTIYNERGEELSILFNEIEKNKIIITSDKKGSLYFYFTGTEIIDIQYKPNSLLSCIYLTIIISLALGLVIFILLSILYEAIEESIEMKKGIDIRKYSDNIDLVIDKKGL